MFERQGIPDLKGLYVKGIERDMVEVGNTGEAVGVLGWGAGGVGDRHSARKNHLKSRLHEENAMWCGEGLTYRSSGVKRQKSLQRSSAPCVRIRSCMR